jgi:uncharacterized membrane protein
MQEASSAHRAFFSVYSRQLLLAKQLWHQYELFILPFAVIFIVSAHVMNFRFCRVQNHAEQDIQQASA